MVACSAAKRVIVGVVEEHCTYQWLTCHCLIRTRIGIWQEHGLEFEVRTIDTCCWFAQGLWILRVATPSIHIQLHWRKGLPLEITDVHLQILSTKDSVHITRNITHSGESRTNIGWDVETDIFPLATRLVARPYTTITLCTCPTVEGNNEWTCVAAIVRHDVSHVSNTIESEGIACTNPCYIGLQHTHTCITHLFDDVALQECRDAIDWVEV